MEAFNTASSRADRQGNGSERTNRQGQRQNHAGNHERFDDPPKELGP